MRYIIILCWVGDNTGGGGCAAVDAAVNDDVNYYDSVNYDTFTADGKHSAKEEWNDNRFVDTNDRNKVHKFWNLSINNVHAVNPLFNNFIENTAKILVKKYHKQNKGQLRTYDLKCIYQLPKIIWHTWVISSSKATDRNLTPGVAANTVKIQPAVEMSKLN